MSSRYVRVVALLSSCKVIEASSLRTLQCAGVYAQRAMPYALRSQRKGARCSFDHAQLVGVLGVGSDISGKP